MTDQQKQPQRPQRPRSKDQKDLSALKGRMTRIENLVHKGHSLETVLPAVAKMSVDEVRALLEFPADRELTLLDLTAGVAWKLNQLSERVDTQESRFNKLLHHFGISEDENGEFVSKALVPALKAGASGGEKSFIRTLRAKGVSDDEIRNSLSILKQDGDDELDLDNSDIFGELYREFVSFRETTTERLDEHDRAITRITGTGEGNLNLPGRVTNLEHSHREIRTMVTETQTVPFPYFGFALGCVLGIVGGWLWAVYPWGSGTHTAKTTVKTKAGTASVTNTMHNDVLASHWWVAALFGVAILAIVTGFAYTLASSRAKSTSESESTTSSSTRSDTPPATAAPTLRDKVQSAKERRQANRARRRQQEEEERAQGSRLLGGVNSDDPRDGETQVLPAAGEEGNRRKKVNA